MKTKIVLLAMSITLLFAAPRLRAQSNTQIRFFAQPGFSYAHNPTEGKSSPYFRSGQFVTYVTSEISDRLSAVGELNVHYMVTEEAPDAQVERLYLRYAFNENYSLRVGKTYNPFGFWNLNYNLGLVLQPTISRPMILQPNHDGGVTQTRDVGVMFEGDNLGKAGFFFKVFLSNGRGKNGGIQGTPYALGKNMSTTLQAGIEPIEGLKFSVSGIYNPLQGGSLNEFNILLPEDLTYSAWAISTTFLKPESPVEVIAEYYNHTNSYKTLGTHTVNGGEFYAGYKVTPRLIPYAYVDFINVDRSDIYYPTTNASTAQMNVNMKSYLIGLRYKFTPVVILKNEVGIFDEEVYGTSYIFNTQLAFSF
jgi:hypothetical protein